MQVEKNVGRRIKHDSGDYRIVIVVRVYSHVVKPMPAWWIDIFSEWFCRGEFRQSSTS